MRTPRWIGDSDDLSTSANPTIEKIANAIVPMKYASDATPTRARYTGSELSAIANAATRETVASSGRIRIARCSTLAPRILRGIQMNANTIDDNITATAPSTSTNRTSGHTGFVLTK